MRDILLVVLSAVRPRIPECYGLSPEEVAQVQAAWDEMQDELAALSSRGGKVIAKQSGHYIHFDQPELVVEAIMQVVDVQQGKGPRARQSKSISRRRTAARAADALRRG